MRAIASAAACLTLLASVAAVPARAQVSGDVIRIGLITDMSGLYADIDGPAGVEAIRMAVADAGGSVAGKTIEVFSADHQNKADIAASKAREWFDTQGLDLLIGGSNSATNLAMAKVAAEKKKLFISIGGISSALAGEQCNPYMVHWSFDTSTLAKGTGNAVVKAGGKTWFFLAADYAFGAQLLNDTSAVVKAAGGNVAGSVKHPLAASDFSSFLLQAQASKADVLALANAGGDTINSIKAAKEFGITPAMKLAGLLVFINDIHSLGLKTTQGMYLTDGWYWNRDAEARAWGRRFFEKIKRMPSSVQAADYSATLQYLKAVKATGTDDADRVLAHLRAAKLDDMYAKQAWIRGDGALIHDMYLMQVKTPDKSVEPWDYYQVVQVFKGEEAFPTKAETKCPLWK